MLNILLLYYYCLDALANTLAIANALAMYDDAISTSKEPNNFNGDILCK